MNRQDWAQLQRFVHGEVHYNGERIGLSGYREMLEGDFREIPDLQFDAQLLVCEPPHISIRQYARLVHRWVESIGLERAFFGTHSMRRTKAAQIYRKIGNLRALQLLLDHTKLESTVRYLGIEVDDALNIAEQIEL
ncbi:site-specific recombinase XerC [Bradyrhizobium sp. F1.4.3]